MCVQKHGWNDNHCQVTVKPKYDRCIIKRVSAPPSMRKLRVGQNEERVLGEVGSRVSYKLVIVKKISFFLGNHGEQVLVLEVLIILCSHHDVVSARYQ